MKKAIIICNAGMSSSFMAKKTTEYLKSIGEDIEITATSAIDGEGKIEKKEYDLYLISPQVRMHFDRFEKMTKEKGLKIAQITFDAYAPVKSGIEKLGKIVLENI